ncbi:MAG: N-acetyltransferase [Pseudomonadota bacterium]
MIYQSLDASNQNEIARLIKTSFTRSDGENEGALVGNLASKLALSIDNDETICLGACENSALVGVIFFTRLRFNTPVSVYMLAPVAVSIDKQGEGIGQALIRHGLAEIRKRSVKIAVTYGDPSFYSKVGFEPLSEGLIKAPLKLSMPFGWLGQSLTDETIPSIDEQPGCVAAFNDPAYW